MRKVGSAGQMPVLKRKFRVGFNEKIRSEQIFEGEKIAKYLYMG